MYTVAILNQKGGSGKSTIAECLAVAAQLDGKAAAILDMDPQGTVYAWSKRREDDGPPVRAVTLANYVDEWQVMKDAGADFVVIDTPARLNDWAMEAASLADLVIVPSKATIKDLERVAATIKLACAQGPMPCVVVLNQVRPQGDRSQQAEDFITAKSFPVCPARLGSRVAFEDSDTLGQTPQETEPSGKAAQEITQVYMFTCKLLNKITSKDVNNGTEEEGVLRRAS